MDASRFWAQKSVRTEAGRFSGFGTKSPLVYILTKKKVVVVVTGKRGKVLGGGCKGGRSIFSKSSYVRRDYTSTPPYRVVNLVVFQVGIWQHYKTLHFDFHLILFSAPIPDLPLTYPVTLAFGHITTLHPSKLS